jgi:hypothetical protein
MVGYPSVDYYEFLKAKTQNGISNAFSLANVSMTFDALKDSLVCINIFYQKLQYTSITESPQKTIYNMVIFV